MPWQPKIYKGYSFERTFTHRNPQGGTIDLTGKIIQFTFCDIFAETLVLRTDDAAPSLKGSSLAYLDAAHGSYKLILTNEETASPHARGTYVIERFDTLNSDPVLLARDQVIRR